MIIYVIIGLALASITYKIVKALDNAGNKNNYNYDNNAQNNNITYQNNNSNFTIKDGMNLFLGKVLGKLIVIIIIILLFFGLLFLF